MITTRISFAPLLVAAALAGCKAGAATSAPPCPNTFKELGPVTGEKSCSCSASSPKGSVWGVDTYTQDSSLCAAAIHAGAIPASGGDVKIKPSAGCTTYAGSTRNGITTGSWGNYPGSFYFVGKGDGACQTATAAAAAPPPAPCPATFKDIPGASPSTELACLCGATAPTTVWGAGIYTQDSSLCGAAVHAGVIPASGGAIKVKAAPGCAKYEGTSQNGITTQSWGAFAGSFYFPSAGEAHCAS